MEINLKLPLGRLFPTLLVLALTAGCSSHSAPASKAGGKPPAVKVKLATVQPATLDEFIDGGVATLQSRRSVTLQPQIDGKITKIFVKYGDRVPAGAPILQVDPAKQQAAVSSSQAVAESAKADIENAKATLKSLQAQRLSDVSNLRYNQQQYERYSTLYSQGAVTRQSLDQYLNSLQTAQANVTATDEKIKAQQANIAKAERALQQSQANVRQQQVELKYYQITAPFAGIVGDIPVKLGDYVNTSTQLTTINQNQPLEVNIKVPAEKAAQVRLGSPVRLLDGQDKLIGNSQVFFISPNIDQNQMVLIKALYENSANQLQVNGYVHAQVISDKRPGVLIPTVAVSRLAGKEFVFVAQPQAQSQPAEQAKSPQGQSPPAQPGLVARQKPVKLGANRGNNVQVLEGLQPGEKIVTAGILNLQDGAPIIPES